MTRVLIDGEEYVKVQQPRYLSHPQWVALERAESYIYRNEHGCHAFTDVMGREDSELAAAVWVQCEWGVESSHDRWDALTTTTQTSLIASRVARCLAMMSFGPEFLLK